MAMCIKVCKCLQLLRRGFFRPIGEDDDTDLRPASMRGLGVGERANAAWEIEKRRARPSLVKLFWRLHACDMTLGLFLSVVYALLSCMLRPLCLKFLIDIAQDDDKEAAMRWAAFLAGVVFLEALAFFASTALLGQDLGGGVLHGSCTLVQRKALRLAPGAAGNMNERTLMQVDIMQFHQNMQMICQLPAAFISLFVGIAVIIITVKARGIVGIIIILSALFLNVQISQRSKVYEAKRLFETDRRLGITTRAIDAMKAVKYCAWEDRFSEEIRQARTSECNVQRPFRLLQFTNMQLGRITPIMGAAITYLCFPLFGSSMRPGDVYAVLTVFQAMRLSLTLIPLSLTYIAQSRVSAKRLLDYLLLPEFEDLPRPDDSTLAIQADNAVLRWPRPPENAKPKVQKGSLAQMASAPPSSTVEDFVLNGIDLKLGRHQKVAIVGSVGSGKSSLISALVGGLQKDSGRLSSDLSSVGFVPQRPFVVSGTVLENVVFGRPWNEALFEATVSASALQADLEQFPSGKETEIGERGVTLSGGQQTRISVARALYGQPSLLVLDDPLAAVDGRVAELIFNKAILGRREGAGAAQLIPEKRLVLMVLNQFSYLSHFDHVIFLRNGRIDAQGPPKELHAEGGAFAAFVGNYISDEDQIKDKSGSGEAEDSQEAQAQNEKRTSVLVEPEKGKKGAVGTNVYWRFFSGMGAHRLVAVIFFQVGAYLLWGFADLWLSHWVNRYNTSKADVDESYYAGIYAGASCLFMAFMLFAGLATGLAVVATAKSVHDDCISHVMRAPMSFFESTPSGRLLSRFGADMQMVDQMLSMLTEACMAFLLTLTVLSIIICMIAPHMIPIMIFSGVLFAVQVTAQDRTNREVKRLGNNAMTPVLNCLGELGEAHGKLLVRVMGFGNRYCDRFDGFCDTLVKYNYAALVLMDVSGLISYMLAVIISTCTSMIILAVTDASPSQLGLALTYAFMLPYFMRIAAVIFGLLKVGITSLERLLQCQSDEIPQEPPWEKSSDVALHKANWPSRGAIRFQDVTLVYRPELPPALLSCSFSIPGAAKAGVVGRTGAGKSSLFYVLFRLIDCKEGSVFVDDENINDMGLCTLRRRMAIIPQDPLLLEGNTRTNVDPFQEHSAERVAAALKRVGLGGHEGSDPKCLSAGQQQLLQMARTLLRDVRIVVMDEPTSNIDPNTDAIVQQVVREEFRDCTVVTIAHRLDTIIDGDMVLVMEKGRVAECGRPAELLSNPKGLFTEMVDGQSHARSAELRKKAGMSKIVVTI